MNTLNVFLHNQCVGELTQRLDHLQFQYHASWLQNDNAFPLSMSLPLQADSFTSPFYFSALLPSGEARARVVEKLKTDRDISLLNTLGGDCLGAVHFEEPEIPIENTSLHQGQVDKSFGKPYLILNDSQWQMMLEQMAQSPLLAGEKGIRCCLPGSKTKFAMYQPGEQHYLPLNGKPSSHIVKFNDDIEHNMALISQAKQIGLPVAQTVAHDNYLVSQRFDRHTQHADITCLHQESFAQAISQAQPNLSDCITVLKRYSLNPALDIKHLTQWVIFHYLGGNTDPDTRNLSLMLLEDGPCLAPFHTFCCPDTPQTKSFDAQYWQTFADQHNMKLKALRIQYDDVIEKLSTIMPSQNG
tara:strand:- start:1313 stop:2380 length:1068 start_codon:yes stop_codon:yes gene_type:complete